MPNLKERYPFDCCLCGHNQTAAPSLFMQMGENIGGGACLACGEYLMLEISDDGEGDCMISSSMELEGAK